ncbi:MAG: 2-oxoacid:acceptor oxidoreductase subunit alpha [Desulfobacteraceae bacterium]|nr:MAG: 2-oxoacid:acceptor oxidoreductase subunit alpha [Desulfobacteraceae bacterium]
MRAFFPVSAEAFLKEEIVVVQGNEAFVLGAIRAGCRFFAGYPITPASEIAERMSYELAKKRGVFIQMEDEIASISAVIGASWGGMKACTATSGPGFSLMQEGIGYAAETETPCVIVDVMRGGPSTGQPTKSSQQDVMQAKYGSHGDYEIIALCPSSVQETYESAIKAFNLSERYRVPVILLTDEIVAHTREKLRIPPAVEVFERSLPAAGPDRYKPYAPLPSGLLDGMPVFGKGYRTLVDGQLHDEWGIRAGHDPQLSGRLMERLCRKITDHAGELEDLENLFTEDADILVIAYGSVSRSAAAAVRRARTEGLRAGMLKLNILWPFPDAAVKAAIGPSKAVIVPEMNIGKISREVERLNDGRRRVVSLPKLGGDLHRPDEILEAIKRP